MEREVFTDLVLRDGRSIRVRPITTDDGKRIEELFYRLSPRTRYFRFQYTKTTISAEEVYHFTHVSPPENMAFAATMRDTGEERIVAVGRWYRTSDPAKAEVSFVVEDGVQVRGLGTALLERLAEAAIKYRIMTFVAAVIVENARMLDVFEESGFTTTRRFDDGVYYLTINLGEKRAFDVKSAQREHVARSAGVRMLLYPDTVAVIGASHKHDTVGGAVFRNVLQSDFAGTVFPVNPTARSIGAVHAYASVLEIPVAVDLAVIVVPARAVPDVVEQCGKKGVKGIVIISAGFGEAGAEGKALQDRVNELVVGYGMRLIGPNCLGVLNFDPACMLNATFSPIAPPAGKLSISTQSGALGLALIDYAKSLNLGLSHFISIGNRVDISSTDLLEFWEDDDKTNVILLYEEAFGDPRKFARIARRVSRKKPIVAVKSGRSEVGARAASSHTGALAASDVAVDAMFREAGVIRVNTISEMFNVARSFAEQPMPRGNRIGILTNAGGPGVLTADACEGWGLIVPPLAEPTMAAMREFLPPSASVRNPVDAIASATPESYRRCLTLMLADPNIDAVVVIYIPPLVTHPDDIASCIAEALTGYDGDKPVLTSFMTLQKGISDIMVEGGRRVPMFTFPEDAVTALGRAWQYQQYKTRDEGSVPEFPGIAKDLAREEALGGLTLSDKPVWLMPEAAMKLLGAYGISSPKVEAAQSADDAALAAGRIGYPVALKLRSATITHKTDVKGVALNLKDEAEVRAAYAAIEDALRQRGMIEGMQGVLVQRMLGGDGGTEIILGMAADPLFGPLVMLGLGGIHVELLKDVAFSIPPLRDLDPERMLKQLKTYPLLTGWRGRKPADVAALKDVLLRFSTLIEDLPEIDQIEINPLVVLDEGMGCSALDCRISVRQV